LVGLTFLSGQGTLPGVNIYHSIPLEKIPLFELRPLKFILFHIFLVFYIQVLLKESKLCFKI